MKAKSIVLAIAVVRVAMALDATPCRPNIAIGPGPRPEVARVDVFWDISKSLRGQRAQMRELEALLDSTVFPLAKIDTFGHFQVGNSVLPVPSHAAVPFATADWTALNDAAVEMAQRLSARESGAAILVSDLELEIPPERRAKPGAMVCPGVAMPKSHLAGPVFGRCFVHASKLSESLDYRVSMFRKRISPSNDLFVLIVSTSPAVGLRLDRLLTERIGPGTKLNFAFQLLTDTSRFAENTKVRCAFAEASSHDVRLSSSAKATGSCQLHCSEADGVGALALRIDTPTSKVLGLGVGRPAVAAKSGLVVDDLADGAYRLRVACSPTRKAAASVTFKVPWMLPAVTPEASSRNATDLLVSLMEAVSSTAGGRIITIGLPIQ